MSPLASRHTPSCPHLLRTSASCRSDDETVDGRDKPGNDAEYAGRAFNLARPGGYRIPVFATMTAGGATALPNERKPSSALPLAGREPGDHP